MPPPAATDRPLSSGVTECVGRGCCCYLKQLTVAKPDYTAALLQVPLFISEGTKVKVDTRTNTYAGRGST